MEERYHATTQNWFYPDMSNVNKNITVETKLISPSTYLHIKWVRGLKWPRHESDEPLHSSAKLKNAWNCTSIPQYAVMARCLIIPRRNNVVSVMISELF